MRRPALLVALLAVASVAAACGGGAKQARDVCPAELAIEPLTFPRGFDRVLKTGPGEGTAKEGVVVFHYEGRDDAYVDVFRGPGGARIKRQEVIRILGHNGTIADLKDGVIGAKVRLGAGKCSRYQFEGHGVTKDELRRMVESVRRVNDAG